MIQNHEINADPAFTFGGIRLDCPHPIYGEFINMTKVPEKPENARIRMKRHRDNMKANNMINLRFWVKKEMVEPIKKFIKKLKINEKKT